MAKKISGWKTKGMNRDLSVSAFNPEFAFENKNLRLSTNEGNTLMSWVNEKGTSSILDSEGNVLSFNGCVIGTAIINKYLILFLTQAYEKNEDTNEIKYYDYIYRLEYSSISEGKMSCTQLFKGSLGFSIEHPLETLVSYESEDIQKVYWTDGINQPRLINIAPSNDDHTYTDKSFDFVTTLALRETVHVTKTVGGGGMFAPGVIQYAFTYYNKYGQESNIFYTTPLYYISYADRGASPEDKVDNTFRISVHGVDPNFDYLRIYSIQRTSVNGTPACRRVQDIEIKSLTNNIASYTDTGFNGDTIDPTELLYKGGSGILAGTMEQKDNTLFIGDITILNTGKPDIKVHDGEKAIAISNNESRKFWVNIESSNDYVYANQLSSYDVNGNAVPCAGFKREEYYRCGIQFQDETGKWSDPAFIDDCQISSSSIPEIRVSSSGGGGGEDDLTLFLRIVNQSNSDITIKEKAVLAIYGSASPIKINGTLSYTGSITILPGKDCQVTIVIKDGKDYSGYRFCTQSETAGLGMNSNIELCDENGNTDTYIMVSVPSSYKLADGSDYTVSCTGVSASAGARPDGEAANTANASAGNALRITVPVIRGTIDSAMALRLLNSGYKKARAVVVYPSMQDREIICQGVVCPTLYTKNHRGGESTDNVTKDLYAQSSWFFRTHSGISGLSTGTYSPYGEEGELPYMDVGVTSNPANIRQVEIQGAFDPDNKYSVDREFLTYHSPDVEFDGTFSVIDYLGLKYKNAGSSVFSRTFSSIDIQTETPTIDSEKSSGFTKKTFIASNTNGIISGLFYEDFPVDDIRDDSDSPTGYNRYSEFSLPARWLVYAWNKNGSLNNDVLRAADAGVRSAVLKKKIISNLRFANTSDYIENAGIEEFTISPQLFASNDTEILKININDNTKSSIYQGNIDSLLIPDKFDGLYFAKDCTVNESDDFKASYTSETDTLFRSNVKFKTFGNITDKDRHGIYYWKGNKWKFVDKNIGDLTFNLALNKENVRMKYKSTKHLVFGTNRLTWNNYSLPVIELRRDWSEDDRNAKMFGGQSEDAKKANIWIPCGEPVNLDKKELNPSTGEYTQADITFEYSWGDTYYQRWDCLKTYAFTTEDINQVVEIGSFMLETHVNIDGRYDRNRGQIDNLYMSPTNFNLLNPVYSQVNNFFTYRIQDDDAYDNKKFPNVVTWSKTKTSGADVDMWTNVTLASTLEMDGDKGGIRKLLRLNDQILCFQDSGISQILYNENVQISSTDGVPIEIANSGKVHGKRYISDSIGCTNKWSIAQSPAGIYFMDTYNKAIFMYNGQLNNLSATYGFNTWCKNNIPDDTCFWTPADYLKDTDTSGGSLIDGFANFTSYYDQLNQEILFINKETALAFSEKLGVFTSFYDYGESPYFCNFSDTGIWGRVDSEPSGGGDPDTPPHMEYTTSLWKHQGGKYCSFFGSLKPYWMTLVGNPEPQTDKIFTNLEFRASVEGDGELNRETGKFTPSLPFDSLETWNEYQHGIAELSIRNGHSGVLHHINNTTGEGASLKRKFRIWRCDIPRDNYTLDSTGKDVDTEKGISRYLRKPLDRMRNPWLYLKLEKSALDAGSLPKTEIHDIVMTYFY